MQYKRFFIPSISIIPSHCFFQSRFFLHINYPKDVFKFEQFSSTTTTEFDIVDLRYTEFTVKKEEIPSKGMAHKFHDPVIFIHGLLGSKRNFNYLGTTLSRQLKKQRRIIAVDLRNHGENDHDWREDMSFVAMAKDVIGVMDKLKFEKVTLVGHSIGGKVAKSMALLFPERISGLVVLDIAPVTYSMNDASWNGVNNIIRSLSEIEFEDGMTKKDLEVQLRSFIDDQALRAFILTNIDQDRNSSTNKSLKWKININAIADELSTLAAFQISDDKSETIPMKYNGDTFFIHGGASRFIRSSHMESIQKYFPNHMLTTIRGAGHFVHAEAPEDTLALLEKYLDR